MDNFPNIFNDHSEVVFGYYYPLIDVIEKIYIPPYINLINNLLKNKPITKFPHFFSSSKGKGIYYPNEQE